MFPFPSCYYSPFSFSFPTATEKLLLHYSLWANSNSALSIAYEYLTYLAESKNFSQLLQFINNMKASKDEKSGLDRWTTFYHRKSHFHTTLLSLFKKTLGLGDFLGAQLPRYLSATLGIDPSLQILTLESTKNIH